MNCPSADVILQYLDGETSVNLSRELEYHLKHCLKCAEVSDEYDRMMKRMALSKTEFENPALKQRILDALPEEEPPFLARSGSRWTRWLNLRVAIPVFATMAFFAAVFIGLMLQHSPRESQEALFKARGSKEKDEVNEKWINFWVFQAPANGAGYQPLPREISRTAKLVFGYLNAEGVYSHLMIFGVSISGAVYWYYPAYEKNEDDPTSIAIAPGKHELKEAISHALPKGELRLYALFTKRPLKVAMIEGIVRDTLRKKPNKLPTRFPVDSSGQLSEWVRVVE